VSCHILATSLFTDNPNILREILGTRQHQGTEHGLASVRHHTAIHGPQQQLLYRPSTTSVINRQTKTRSETDQDSSTGLAVRLGRSKKQARGGAVNLLQRRTTSCTVREPACARVMTSLTEDVKHLQSEPRMKRYFRKNSFRLCKHAQTFVECLQTRSEHDKDKSLLRTKRRWEITLKIN
jgi:hypothetical protein